MAPYAVRLDQGHTGEVVSHYHAKDSNSVRSFYEAFTKPLNFLSSFLLYDAVVEGAKKGSCGKKVTTLKPSRFQISMAYPSGYNRILQTLRE
jgi:hypothetical protein